MALGGDLVQVEIEGSWDGLDLEKLPGVRQLHRIVPGRFWVVADNAGQVTPEVVAAVSAAGVEMISVREYRPSFDEIFAALVHRDRDGDAASGAVAPAAFLMRS